MGIVVRPSPPQVQAASAALKMHLRVLTLNRHTYHVVTLRPDVATAFSTNYFHDTWHIVSSQQGAHLLARLFWGLAYQRRPGTLLLIHGDHLRPTPFEGERSDPFVIVPAGLTSLDAADLRLLKSRLPSLGPPTKTIRWQTFGLDLALQADAGDASKPALQRVLTEWQQARTRAPVQAQERMERLGGFIAYAAPPLLLRLQALQIHALRVKKGHAEPEMDYHFLGASDRLKRWCYPDGEVQIFADYMDRVAAAVAARHELAPAPQCPVLAESLQEAISRRRDTIKARRRRNQRRWQH